MSENPRIEELRRRVQSDPTSIAFAALAEEYRRAGRYDEAIEVCRSGLTRHPAYISARVTLGRALLETNKIDEAAAELEQVLKIAPENLTATRALTEIAARRSTLPTSSPVPAPTPEPKNGFEQDLMAGLTRAGVSHPAPVPGPTSAAVQPVPARVPIPVSTATRPAPADAPPADSAGVSGPAPVPGPTSATVQAAPARLQIPVSTASRPVPADAPPADSAGVVERLQHFLNTIRTVKAQRSHRAAR